MEVYLNYRIFFSRLAAFCQKNWSINSMLPLKTKFKKIKFQIFPFGEGQLEQFFEMPSKKYFFGLLKSVLLFFIVFAFSANAFSKNKSLYNRQAITKWTTNPFKQKVFIENKSQFDGRDSLPNSRILYGVRNDGLQIYFTPKGLTYRHDEVIKMSEQEKEKYEKEGKEVELMNRTKTSFENMQWLNSNPDVQIVAENPVDNYFTYGDLRDKTGKTTIKATAYKTIIYKNLYPNIDVVFTFPENKEGIKYSIILHTGADASLVKIKYSGSKNISLDKDGNIEINSSLGTFIDHKPITSYQDGSTIASAFNNDVSNNIVSFNLNTYNHTKTVIIDPWVTTPTFTLSSNAYDVDCDWAGNVYIYGGNNPYQESKLNSAGTILWTYTSTPFTGGLNDYGDFAVDEQSENSYLVEGGDLSGAKVVKVSPTGAQLALFTGNANMTEMWRIVFNNCTHTSVIAGGGINADYQAGMLDSNLVTFTPVNTLSASSIGHDFALLAQDNVGNCYMATATSVIDPTFASNILLKAPIPALLPTAYQVSDGYAFQEVGSVAYIGPTPNGFNGMCVSSNFLYTYDGAVLKKWNPSTGVLLASVTVTATSFQWGGLQVDDCDHIFVGANDSIKQYDVNLNLVSKIAASNTVYDLKLGQNGLLYACGLGFVQSFQVTLPPCSSSPTLSMSSTCNTATVAVSGGTAPYTYSWSTVPVQTTSTATGLSAGKYYVTVTSDNSCIPSTQKDSITIVPGGVTTTASPSDICGGSSSTLTASGVSTYSWSNGATTNPITVTPAVTTTYTVTGNTGCSATVKVTVNPKPTVTVNSATICNGTSATLTASGGTSYSWSTGATTNPITVSPTSTTSYTVTGTDVNGCTNTVVATVTISLVTASFIANPDSGIVPLLVNFTNTSTGANTYQWNLGNGDTTNAVNPSTTYGNTGIYNVELIVTNAHGCKDTAYGKIDVLGQSMLIIPNVFSPNGDGKNDVFMVKFFAITSFQGEIFDRWGIKLYEWNNANGGWDGRTTSGVEAPSGTYYYLITAVGADGKQYKEKGYLTLLR